MESGQITLERAAELRAQLPDLPWRDHRRFLKADESCEKCQGAGFMQEEYDPRVRIPCVCLLPDCCFDVDGQTGPICSVDHGKWGDYYWSIRQVPGSASLDNRYEVYRDGLDYGEISIENARITKEWIANSPEIYDLLIARIKQLEHDYDECRGELAQAWQENSREAGEY